MDKRLQFTGGEPDVRLNQILVDADANRPAMFAMMNSYSVGTNPNYIVSGCAVVVGGSAPNNTWDLAIGYIYLNNEIVQVDAQSGVFDSATEFLAFSKDVTYDPIGDKTFIDATPRQTWQKNRGLITVQGSVLITELDAIDGDNIDDKLREYLGIATTSEIGLVEKSTPSENVGGASDKYPDAAAMLGIALGSDPTSALVTLSAIVNDIKTFYGLKRLNFSGNIAYSSSVIVAGSILFTIPITSWSPAPAHDIYGVLFLDIGGVGDNNWTALKIKYTTARTVVTIEDTPAAIAGTNPFNINIVY